MTRVHARNQLELQQTDTRGAPDSQANLIHWCRDLPRPSSEFTTFIGYFFAHSTLFIQDPDYISSQTNPTRCIYQRIQLLRPIQKAVGSGARSTAPSHAGPPPSQLRPLDSVFIVSHADIDNRRRNPHLGCGADGSNAMTKSRRDLTYGAPRWRMGEKLLPMAF